MDMARLVRPLGAVTAASLVLAAWALVGERRIVQQAGFDKFLPAYGENIAAAKSLKITHGRGLSGTTGIHVRRGENGWQLAERWDYPANDELVTETLLALADIDLLEARTAQADWHRVLGLVAPEDLGKAVRFEVLDGAQKSMARILLGKDETSEAEAVQKLQAFGAEKTRFYVRREDRAQSWLALGRLPRNPEPAAWIDPSLARHDRAEMVEISFGKNNGFKAVKVGEAWSMAGADGWIDGFYALRPDDVAREENIEFATARPFTVSYQNGLAITYENVGAATVIWSRISAKTEAGARAETKKLAAALNERFNGWALRFAAERTPILLPSKADLQR